MYVRVFFFFNNSNLYVIIYLNISAFFNDFILSNMALFNWTNPVILIALFDFTIL